jgi:hypothetical protein
MAPAHVEEAMISNALHSCPALCSAIGLQGLACLATGSIRLNTDIADLVCSPARKFLQAAIDTARADGQHKHHEAVAWVAALLLHSAPAADVTRQLHELPAVPLDCAMQMVAAGLRISHAQLLAAADSMVEGVEVWVQAQEELHIQTDVPAAAVAFCCGCNEVSEVSAAACPCEARTKRFICRSTCARSMLCCPHAFGTVATMNQHHVQ